MTNILSQLLALPSSWLPRSGSDVYQLCQLAFLSTPLLVPILQVVSAPHGRFSIPSSLNVHGNWGWFLMEVVSPITFTLAFLSEPLSSQPQGLDATLSMRDVFSPSLARLRQIPATNQVMAAAFLLHYLNRAVISPWRSPKRSPLHLSVPLCAMFFNLINGLLMGSWLGGRSPPIVIPLTALEAHAAAVPKGPLGWLYSAVAAPAATLAAKALTSRLATGPGLSTLTLAQSFASPIWLAGMAGWFVGFLGNIYHDEILLDLRRPRSQRVTRSGREASDDDDDKDQAGKPKYSIPQGGLYQFVSFPNYLCEWFEWLSFAVAALSVTGLSPTTSASASLPLTHGARAALILTSPPVIFLIAEFMPMFPRALQGHQWYRTRFGVEGDGKGGRYPKTRKAVLPGIL
ncbi:unnamed protein product [Parajaminaea phylloscopi]